MSRNDTRALPWAIAFWAPATLGLVALDAMLWLMHGMAYGVAQMVPLDDGLAPPDEGSYTTALALGALVSLTGACCCAWLAARTPARTWPPAAQGLTAALLAAVLGGSALLMTLGIDPVDFLRSL